MRIPQSIFAAVFTLALVAAVSACEPAEPEFEETPAAEEIEVYDETTPAQPPATAPTQPGQQPGQQPGMQPGQQPGMQPGQQPTGQQPGTGTTGTP